MNTATALSKAKQSLRRAAGRVQDVVLPPVCLACETGVDARGTVCSQCWSGLRFIEPPFCAVLGTPFARDLGTGAKSAAALARPPSFDRARATVFYDDVARQLVQALKFSDRTDLAPWMAQWMVESLHRTGEGLLDANPIVVPVPLHRRRLISRRFNQSAELARALARAAHLSYAPDFLHRIRPTRQQVGLDASARHSNVRGAFRVPTEHKPQLAQKRVLLIDDVHTTGATLEACSRALRRAGAAQIDCITFARVAPDKV
ncbi:ComF family protein [Pseudahrensia aquimaris]|uniref:ComF family protein n=1 Tax=Pseudahrensia aquimaris TaxID=744461 RepID=A0ABW3F9W2_9HYPH